MLAWLKSLFVKKQPPRLQPWPLEVNPGTGIRVERNTIRLARLEIAIAQETDKKRKVSLQAECDRRKQFGR